MRSQVDYNFSKNKNEIGSKCVTNNHRDKIMKVHYWRRFCLKSVKSVILGLLLVMMGTVLVGCSSGEITTTTDESASSQVERSTSESEEDEASSSSADDKVTSSSEDEAETSSSATSDSSENQVTDKSSSTKPSTSVTTASSSSVTPAPHRAPSHPQGNSSQARPHVIPDSKVSTVGDPRIWGNPRTKLYYTPAQNYRGFRPRHAVPFDNEAAAKAAGYTQSPRRPR